MIQFVHRHEHKIWVVLMPILAGITICVAKW